MYLDEVKLEGPVNTVTLLGELNGNLCSDKQPEQWIRYRLEFKGVLALRVVELDSRSWEGQSSFDEVMESDWIRDLGGKVTEANRHFVLQTYDDVFDVICREYELTLISRRSQDDDA